jgi:SAM-dependent methyltransferase
MAAQYYPNVFETPDIDRAKAIILTNEGPGSDTETRWAVETPYLLHLIQSSAPVGPETIILDYGCGIGRMAKALIAATGCSVIGVDISPSMRALAKEYVGSQRFVIVSPEQLDVLIRAGTRVHLAIAIWVLQHCFAPANDIARIKAAMAVGGHLCVLNMPHRAVPAVTDATAESASRFLWAADGIDIAALLRENFVVRSEISPDIASIPSADGSGIFWMCVQHCER